MYISKNYKNKIITIIDKLILYYTKQQKEINIKKALLYSNNKFQKIIAIILSATVSDERINKCTINLFKIIKTKEDFINTSDEIIYKYIKTIWLHKKKLKIIKEYIKLSNTKPTIKYNDLIKIKYLGPKTAYLILSHLYDKTNYIIVDRHVRKFSNKVLNTKNNIPLITKLLNKILENKNKLLISKIIIIHMRYCKSNKKQYDFFINDNL